MPGPGEPPLPPFPGRETAFGATSLFVREAGAAPLPPAVLIHGLGGASTNWTDLMALLSDRLHLFAPDLPGFGRSEPFPDRDYRLGRLVGAVLRLVETQAEAHGGPVHLFGNSLGGAVATRLAATRPDLVRSLTLISPALPVLRPPSGMEPRALLLTVPGLNRLALARTEALTPAQRARAILELCYYDASRVPEERRREAVEEMDRRGALGYSDAVFAATLRALIGDYLRRGPQALWRQAGQVRAPVLLVWGRHDKLVDVRVAARAARAFPRAHLVVFEDAGHVAQLEKPEETAHEVRSFLARLAREEGEKAGYSAHE